MFRFIGAVGVLGLLTSVASAQSITAPEGNWVWQAELNMNGLKLNNEGTECITAENAELDLARAALGIDEACSIFGWNPDGDVIHFALACLGDQDIDMAGELRIDGETASLNLKGDVRLVDASPLTATGVATATRVGVCNVPADVLSAEPEAVETAALADETEVAMDAVIAQITVIEADTAETVVDVIVAETPVEGEIVAPAGEIDMPLVEAAVSPTNIDAQIEPVLAGGELLALPEPVFVAEAPIVAPIPVEDAS